MTVEIEDPARARGRASTYVVEPLRLLYVGLPKVACTSTKWMVAELAGENLQAFRKALKSAPTRRQTIHWRDAWQHARRFRDLSAEDRRLVCADNGWFVWTMVRDPRARLWSAWQSKLLVRNPGYVRQYAGEPWFPRIPKTPAHVIEDFARFVEALGRGEVGPLAGDVHFGCQSDLLDATGVETMQVYDLSRSAEFRADLGTHLAAFGRTVPQARGYDNETPLRLTGDVLAGGVGEAIEAIYARDFQRFGRFWNEPPRTVEPASWTPAAMADVATRVHLHGRLADLRGLARRMDRRIRTLESQLVP